MTDPKGKMFISYRRSQADIAEALVKSLNGHGVQTWQDVTDLRTEPTQVELKGVLDDPEIAGGIVLVSEDVPESDIILDLELPELHTRWRNDENFFVVVALCPGVDYEDASDILAECPTVHDFSNWNMIKLGPEGDTASAVNDVSTSVLSERVQLVHEQLDDDQPLDCSIDTYGPPTHSSQPAVTIDWSANFIDGFPASHTWEQYLLPWLNEVIDIVEQSTQGRPLRFRANAHLPATFALGWCLQTTRGIEATWLQQNNGETTPWQVHTDGVDCGLNSDLQMNNVSGSDLAVLVSVTNKVNSAVGRSR